MAKRTMNLEFPLAGVNRRVAYQKQPPYTTPDALNVRPDAGLEGRARGGSRPGLTKPYAEEIKSTGGSGGKIRMLEAVRVVGQASQTEWLDGFDGLSPIHLGGAWDESGWTGYYSLKCGGSQAIIHHTHSPAAVVMASSVANVDTSEPYTISATLDVALPQGVQSGDYKYWDIYLRMDDAAPVWGAGAIRVRVANLNMLYSNDFALYIYDYSVDSTVYVYKAELHNYFPNTLSLSIAVSGNTITPTWAGEVQAAYTASSPAGARIGFGGETSTSSGHLSAQTSFNDVALLYTDSLTPSYNELRLCASGGDGVLFYSQSGSMNEEAENVSLGTNAYLQAAQLGGLLYIADRDAAPGASGTDGTATVVAGANNDTFDDDAGTVWSSIGTATNYVLVLESGAAAGAYRIGSWTTTVITLTDALPAGGPYTSVRYRIERLAKKYDPTAAENSRLVEWWATTGTMPDSCPLLCRYRGRIVLAGDRGSPHVWYMSRQNGPLDFDYSGLPSDGGRAVAGTSTEAGVIAEPLTALIPHGDDYLIFGCATSLYVLRGDAAMGGRIDNLSRDVGVVSAKAWCYTPEGQIVFLGRGGLYAVSGGSPPTPFSQEKLPDDLRGIQQNETAFLAYDVSANGIHVFVVREDQQNTHWWYSRVTDSFWPVRVDEDYEPFAITEYAPDDPTDSEVLLGCRDGHIRRFNKDAHLDDGGTFDSHVEYGPFRMHRNGHQASIVSELVGSLGEGSGDAQWELRSGDTAEGAHDAEPMYDSLLMEDGDEVLCENGDKVSLDGSSAWSALWNSGLNYGEHPRLRGNSFILKLMGTRGAAAPWAVERVKVGFESAGPERLL